MAGLVDAPGRGRLSSLEAKQIEAVLSRVVQPPAHLRRWSCRTMARESGLSKSAVQKLWASNDLKPHLSRTFKLSTDPQFEAKFWDIVLGLPGINTRERGGGSKVIHQEGREAPTRARKTRNGCLPLLPRQVLCGFDPHPGP